MSDSLLELEGVERYFRTRQGVVRAVDTVSLEVGRREAVGLVGESGSGKSTLGRVALRLYDVGSGRIRFDGQDITGLHGRKLRLLRTRFQMVFQDPLSSLDPHGGSGSWMPSILSTCSREWPISTLASCREARRSASGSPGRWW